MTKSIITLGLVLLVWSNVSAQALRFNLLNSQDGLPQNSVRAISQDKNGLMWFATEDGIARYDGQRIETYTHQPGAQSSLPENVVNAFIPNDNQLWIAMQGEGGVSVLNQSNQQFSPIAELQNANETFGIGNVVFAIYQRSKDEMLVGSKQGVYSVSTADLTVKKQLIAQQALKNEREITAIWEGPDKNVWVTSADGQLAMLDSNDQLNIIPKDKFDITRFKRIPSLGDLLLSDAGLLKIDYQNQSLTPLFKDSFLEDVEVRDIVESFDGKVWIATRSGLIRYDPVADTAVLAARNPEDENSLPTNELNTLYISTDGILWIGTSDKGVAYTNLKGFGFTSFSIHNLQTIHPKPSSPDKLSSFDNNMIWSIFRDSRDTLWLGHTDGICRQLAGENSYQHFSSLGNEKNKIDVSESWFMTTTEADGFIWFGTWGDGLLRYKPDTKDLVVYSKEAKDPNHRLSGDVIRLLQFDEARNWLWVGTHYNGLNRIDLTTGKITQFKHDPNDDFSFPHSRTRALHLDKQGQLWVGSGNGAARFDPDTERFIRVKRFENGEATTDVRDLFRADDDTLWSATGNGLDRINIKTMQVDKKYLERDGLSRSTLYGIVPDNHGKLWLPSARGLTEFSPKQEKFKRYFLGHNLQANEFNFNTYHKEKDGSIILGGVGGITKFKPNEIKGDPASYDPVILSMHSVDNEFVQRQVLGVTNTSSSKDNPILLTSNQRSLIIDFVIPEYTFSEGLDYEYELLGSEDQWIRAKPRDTPIRYTNLKAGKYAFRIRKAGSPTTDEPLTVHIKIEKHLWETIWFRLLLATATFLAGLLLIRAFSSYRLEKQIASERSELYSMVVHDLGPALKRTQEDLGTLRETGENDAESCEILSGLESDNQYSMAFINQLRAISTVEGFSKHNRELFLLEDIVDEALNQFRQQKHRIKLTQLPDCSVRVHENSIEFVLTNLLSNALKYSDEETTVTLDISQRDNKHLMIKVVDQGKGIRDSFKAQIFKRYQRDDYYKTEGLGIGLTLVKSITQKYQGDIAIENNTPQGTIFLVSLNNIVVIE